MKNSLGLKSSYAWSNLKKKKKKNCMELEFMELEFHSRYSSSINSSSIYLFIFYFLSLIAPYLIFYKSSFTLKLDFEKIKFQKKDISLFSLRKGAKRWFFCTKRTFAHFGPQSFITPLVSNMRMPDQIQFWTQENHIVRERERERERRKKIDFDPWKLSTIKEWQSTSSWLFFFHTMWIFEPSSLFFFFK